MAGSITAANEAIFATQKGKSPDWAQSFNWRIIPATAGLALALTGLEKLTPQFAVGLAWLTLATVLIVPFGNAPTPLENFTSLIETQRNT